MLSLQTLSDRLEIEDLVNYYAEIIDRKRFDELKNVFTSDAFIDYSVYGGEEAKGDLPTIINYLTVALPAFPHTQHLNANIRVKLDGDQATGQVMCFNPMEMTSGETFFLGLYYHDAYRRTDKGWRISKRVEEKCWKFALPKRLEP